MSKHNLRYLRNEVIKEVTAQRMREYDAQTGTAVPLHLATDYRRQRSCCRQWVDSAADSFVICTSAEIGQVRLRKVEGELLSQPELEQVQAATRRAP